MTSVERWDPVDGGWQLVASAHGIDTKEALILYLEELEAPAGFYRAGAVTVDWPGRS